MQRTCRHQQVQRKKDDSLAFFGRYARSLRSLRGRSASVEDDDAPKFVTHWKGTTNKKTTSNKYDSSALIDDDWSDPHDDEGPFGLPDVDPLIANTSLSDSGINKIQANDDDEVNSLCSEIYNNTSLFPDLDESVGLMDLSVQHPPKRQVTTKRAKK